VKVKVLLLLFLILFPVIAPVSQNQAFSQTTSFQGQLSGWVIGNDEDGLISQTGFRYIPELFIETPVSDHLTLDFELSANVFGTLNIQDDKHNETDSDIKAYRIWGRLSGDQFETRIGLQKLNFGSATLFRPLRWFDKIDPRDPLKLTDGVYGLLMRYYFQNNANIWLWSLYGNDDTKGEEIVPTKKGTPEFGGRLQVPVSTGEIGVSYHHRKADFSQLSLLLAGLRQGSYTQESSIGEDRLGLDGKWDIGIGIWFEGSLAHHQTKISHLKYQQALTVGMDYTFNIGNGLNALGEYNISGLGDTVFDTGNKNEFIGLSLSYPIGLMDNLSSIIYCETTNSNLYRTMTWQRLMDNWSFFLIGFWNPEEQSLNQDINNAFSGKGFQLMGVFNH